MQKIKKLEIKKLFKKLQLVETEYEYTSELISEADKSFMNSLNSLLDKYPDLKRLYNKKLDEVINKSINNNIKDYNDSEKIYDVSEESEEEEDEKYITEDKKIKRLYREIVKRTHPDKVKDDILNNLYIESTLYFKINDKIGIYKICDILNINYDIDIDDKDFLINKINEFENKISFLESTFTWIWFNSDDKKMKENILIEFIKNKIK